jgi:hypothetical protein
MPATATATAEAPKTLPEETPALALVDLTTIYAADYKVGARIVTIHFAAKDAVEARELMEKYLTFLTGRHNYKHQPLGSPRKFAQDLRKLMEGI